MSNPEPNSPTQSTRSLSPSDRSPGPRMTIHKDTFPNIRSSLLEGLTGAASHGQGATPPPRIRNNSVRASFSSETGRDVVLEGKRKQVVEDVRELFCARPTYEIFERSWRKDAIYEDPISHARGYHEYAPQWYGLVKVISRSETIEYRLLSSTHNPNRIIYHQKQQYTLRLFGIKYTLESIVVIGLDDDDMITKVENRWSGNDHPTRYGTLTLRRLTAKAIPWVVSAPGNNYPK